jgi:RecJ-like exonuclease
MTPADTPRPAGQDSQPAARGDQAPPGTQGTGENVCPRCGGSGKLPGDQRCPECGGTGHVTTGIGGG